MRSAILLTFTLIAGCSRELPTYDQVVALAREESRAVQVKDWEARVFDPFWKAHKDGVVLPCAHLLKEGERVTPRFVVDASASSRPLPIRDESQTPISRCLESQLRELDWPTPPADLRYVPIEVALRKRPAELQKPAA
jgi:hypothetical protein